MPAAVAAAAAAAASGAGLLACLLCTCRPQTPLGVEGDGEEESLLSRAEAARGSGAEDGDDTWPDRPPASCCEAAAVAARTARRTWELTVGRWGLHGIAFGIKRHMKRQGNLQHEYSGNDCLRLKGHQVHTEVTSLLEYLKLCMFYSKKTFSAFLKFGGYNQEDVLIHKARARLMQPSFALVRDKKSKCFLLFIRGAISTKERLTAATAAEVPFHHIVLNEGQISNVILGYAHCGMLAVARWIANLAIPHLHNAVREFPDYQIKVIGHSMGAGIGSILTYILREHYEFSSCTCLAFAPAACMTWELAESGKEFITSLVNRNDVVPAFSEVSVESLRSEPLLKHAAEITQPEANELNIDCSKQQADFMANPEPGLLVVSVVTSEERIDSASVKSVAGSGFTSQGNDVDSDKALDTEQASLTINEEEALKQNGAGKHKQKESASAPGSRHLFPPGRIIHMVALPQPQPDPNPGEGTSSNEIIGIYETPRDLYGKIRLAPNMINEHYMPSYVSTMESLLEQLQNDDTFIGASSNQFITKLNLPGQS